MYTGKPISSAAQAKDPGFACGLLGRTSLPGAAHRPGGFDVIQLNRALRGFLSSINLELTLKWAIEWLIGADHK